MSASHPAGAGRRPEGLRYQKGPRDGRAPFPTRGSYALLALAFMGFAVYASLVPFSFRPVPMDEAVASFVQHVWRLPSLGSLSRSDAVANLLLFVPIGFCLSGTLRLGARAWWSGPIATLAVLVLAGSLSAVVEFLQLFTAGRIASSRDIAAQVAGTLTGNVLWEALGSELTAWMRATLGSATRRQRLERLLFVYAGAWVLLTLAPFDLTLDAGQLARKARSDGLVLSLFGRTGDSALDLAWDAFRAMVAAIPLGVLAFLLQQTAGWRPLLRAVRLAAGVVLVTEVLQFFVVSRVADITDAVSGGVGAVSGVLLAAWWTRRPPRAGLSSTDRRTAAALLGAWCLVLVAYHWMPYDFVWDSAAIRGKLAGLSLIPFAGYHRGADLNSLDQLLLKLWLSVPVGFLSGFLASGPAPARRLWVAGWLAAVGLLFAVIEAGQLLLPSRFPDPSDILVAVAGAAVGLAATFWLLEPRS